MEKEVEALLARHPKLRKRYEERANVLGISVEQLVDAALAEYIDRVVNPTEAPTKKRKPS